MIDGNDGNDGKQAPLLELAAFAMRAASRLNRRPAAAAAPKTPYIGVVRNPRRLIASPWSRPILSAVS